MLTLPQSEPAVLYVTESCEACYFDPFAGIDNKNNISSEVFKDTIAH
jgi:hypothetical protein